MKLVYIIVKFISNLRMFKAGVKAI